MDIEHKYRNRQSENRNQKENIFFCVGEIERERERKCIHKKGKMSNVY